MSRIKAIDPSGAQGQTKQLFDAVKGMLGVVPNMMRQMAASPAVLEGYLALAGALGRGALPPRVREQLALDVGEANGCEYCVSAHTALGRRAGLSDEEVIDSRRGGSADPKTAVLLRFARTLVEARGRITDADVARVRDAGWNDAAIAEVVAHVALNVFTNYFNNVAATEIDFPKVTPLTA